MATTYFTVNNRIRERINDVLQDTDSDSVDDDLRSMLTDEQLEEFIIQNIESQPSGYIFQRMNATSSYFKYYGLSGQYHFFDPSFTEENDVLTSGASTNVAPSTTILTAAGSTFISDGIEAGYLVTNVTTGETATVVSVDSETQITTTAITGSYTALDTFTINRVVQYEFHSNGYIKINAGTATSTNITITASIVNMGVVLYDIFMYLASHYAQKASFSVVNGQVLYDNVYTNLVKHAHLCRGVYSV